MKVLKFGGTSVANAQNIKLVLDIVQNQAKQDQLIVVVSASVK
jgi:aspartokinase/homoserine dehydrogenase 1